MIRLDQDRLQRMIPEMTEEFSDRMHRMIHALPHEREDKQVKHLTLRAVIMFAVIAALMSTTAFALTRPAVLNWLLGSSPASRQLEQTAQSIIGEGTADGVTARITSLVYDGSQFAFAYEVENSDPATPVLVSIDPSILLDGTEATLWHSTADTTSPQMIPSPHLDVLPVQRNPAIGGGWSNDIDCVLTGEITCEMTFIVYRPEKGFAVMLDPDDMLQNPEEYDPEARAEIEDSLNTLRSFSDTVIVENSPEAEASWRAQGYTVLGRSGRPLSPVGMDSTLKETARITVTFTFDSSNTIAYDFSGAADIPLADCLVQVARFRLTPLETVFDLRLVPTENSREAAQALSDRYGAWLLTDERSKPVEFSQMDTMYTWRPYVTEIDGQWVCRYLESLPGLLRFPQSIGFSAGGSELLRFQLATPE